MARIELRRAPTDEVTKTVVLFQRGITHENERGKGKRDEGMETKGLWARGCIEMA
jgi:hypothetical protein